ncbi:pseudouridine synthase family protein [Halobacteriovorax sp. RZ-2]|uniref:pseudouridine synthase family protein n=1 Tax=unclassified Halobacteriovorax TaxID=2639665 RepID=UPI003718C020
MATKLKHNKNFCNLTEKDSLKEFLKGELHFSNKAIKTSYISKVALQSHLAPKSELYLPRDLLNRFHVNPIYTGQAIEVIHEDDIFIVLNKPQGIHGHPMEYSETDTVLNFMRSHFNLPSLGNSRSDYEKGLLYRLDQLTSGVLIYIKDELIHENLRNSFSQIAKEKTYLAIVKGKVEEGMDLTDRLVSSGIKGEKMIVNEIGVEATLRVEPVFYQDKKNLSLVKVTLNEGHRHQIRVQLSHAGFPIIGDPLYNEDYNEKEDQRLYLHAFQYCLDVNGHTTCFKAETADLFCDLLDLDSLMDVAS